MEKILKINISFPTMKQISNKVWWDMKDHAIKDWHFEWAGEGVKPVTGKFDPNNPNHVPVKDVIKVRMHP